MNSKLKTKLLLIMMLIGILIHVSPAFAVERAERITDREIIESLTELKEGQKALQRQIDDLKTLMLWGFGILFGGMGMLIGFVLWDRRTALAPAVNKTIELQRREEQIENILKEFAKAEPKLAEIMKSFKL